MAKPPSEYKRQRNEFVKFCYKHNLEQVNNLPTRNNNVLDLVLADEPLLVSNLNVDPPLGKSDHNSVLIHVVIAANNNEYINNLNLCDAERDNNLNRQLCYCWSKTDWLSFECYLSNFDWNLVFVECMSANDCWNMFVNILNVGIPNFYQF